MGEGTVQPRRRAVIIASTIGALEPLVDAAGFEIAGVANTAINGEQLLDHIRPEVVVVDNDLMGQSGWEAIPALQAASPTTAVILVVAEDWTPRDLGATGAFAVVTRHRLSELVGELGGVEAWLERRADLTGGRTDRRTGRDRRVHQDWTKVGWERREQHRRLVAS